MYISKYRSGCASREDLRERRVRDLAVERDDVPAPVAERLERVAVRLARRDVVADLVRRKLERAVSRTRCGSPSSSGFATSIVMLRIPPSSSIAASGSSSALPWKPSLFSTAFTPLPLIVLATITVGAPVVSSASAYARVDRLHVVAVDLDRMPAEGLGPLRVRVEIPAVHRLAALAEPVHVDDRDQVVELLVPGVLERLPHRALGHLAVAAQHPDPVREPVEPLARERDPDAVRQAPGRASRSPRRPTAAPESDAPRAGSRTCGT